MKAEEIQKIRNSVARTFGEYRKNGRNSVNHYAEIAESVGMTVPGVEHFFLKGVKRIRLHHLEMLKLGLLKAEKLGLKHSFIINH